MTTVTDNFNRSNGAPGSNWTHVGAGAGTFAIASNQLAFSGGADWTLKYLRWAGTALASTNIYVQASIRRNEYECGVFLRGAASGTNDAAVTGYFFSNWGSGYYIGETGVNTVTWSSLGDYSAGDGGTFHTLRIEAEGTAIRAYLDGVLRISATDSTFTAAGFGIVAMGGNAITADDFEAGDLGGGVTRRPSGILVPNGELRSAAHNWS
ncbi:MAG: hypothetical protein ACOYD4_06825 [Solirubrobacterales bacterium]